MKKISYVRYVYNLSHALAKVTGASIIEYIFNICKLEHPVEQWNKREGVGNHFASKFSECYCAMSVTLSISRDTHRRLLQ